MAIKSSQEILSQCLKEEGVLNTKLKSEQEVLNLVYDDTGKALNVAITGLTTADVPAFTDKNYVTDAEKIIINSKSVGEKISEYAYAWGGL